MLSCTADSTDPVGVNLSERATVRTRATALATAGRMGTDRKCGESDELVDLRRHGLWHGNGHNSEHLSALARITDHTVVRSSCAPRTYHAGGRRAGPETIPSELVTALAKSRANSRQGGNRSLIVDHECRHAEPKAFRSQIDRAGVGTGGRDWGGTCGSLRCG